MLSPTGANRALQGKPYTSQGPIWTPRCQLGPHRGQIRTYWALCSVMFTLRPSLVLGQPWANLGLTWVLFRPTWVWCRSILESWVNIWIILAILWHIQANFGLTCANLKLILARLELWHSNFGLKLAHLEIIGANFELIWANLENIGVSFEFIWANLGLSLVKLYKIVKRPFWWLAIFGHNFCKNWARKLQLVSDCRFWNVLPTGH